MFMELSCRQFSQTFVVIRLYVKGICAVRCLFPQMCLAQVQKSSGEQCSTNGLKILGFWVTKKNVKESLASGEKKVLINTRDFINKVRFLWHHCIRANIL